MPIQNYPTVFDCTEMTAAVNKLPALPVYFRRLFEVKGVKSTTVSLDIKKGRIVLIGDSPRNTAPESLAGLGPSGSGSTSPARIWRSPTRWLPKTSRMSGRSAPPNPSPLPRSTTTRCSS